MSNPPPMLLDAFRRLEKREAIAVLVADEGEGFDAVTMRVLSAWENTINQWKAPPRTCPDSQQPTPAAWQWLRSGWTLDAVAVARGADVSITTARTKLDRLVDARLIYPDGSMADAAKNALRIHVASRLVPGGVKKATAKKAADPSEAN